MKLPLLFFLIPFSISLAHGQNFAPVGATWYYTQVSIGGPEVNFTYIESLKDTVIDGVECRQLGGNPSECVWTGEFVFDSNDSVFFWHPDRQEFCLLYYFDAEVNDTWTVHHITSNFGSGLPDSSVVRVDSVGTETVSGQDLRVLYLSHLNPFINYWEFGGKVIERIGSLFYLFPYLGVCDPVPGDLRCYQDSVIFFKQGPYHCDEILSSISEVKKVDIKVFPNPTSGIVTVGVSEPIIGERILRVFDMNGREVFTIPINSLDQRLSIDLTSIDSGIYSLELNLDDQYLRTRVILIR